MESKVEFGLRGHVGPYSFVDLVWRRQVERWRVCVFVLRGRDVLDIGFGVHGVVLHLFVGRCPRRSQRQEPRRC
jgi:hypothetical protein